MAENYTLSPDNARQFAAALIDLADQADALAHTRRHDPLGGYLSGLPRALAPSFGRADAPLYYLQWG